MYFVVYKWIGIFKNINLKVNVKYFLKFIFIFFALVFLSNRNYGFEDKDSNKTTANATDKKETKDNGDSTKTAVKNNKVENTPAKKRRGFKIEEIFILTDKTRANTFRVNSEKEWMNFKDKISISYDIFGQQDDNRSMKVKVHRIELNYKLYASNLKEKDPFIEYCYSSDQPTKLNWKVLAGGMGRKLPFDLKLDIGYGYKWGKVSETEVYKYDVVTFNLNNKKKISNFNISQNFKIITPRNIENNKQPIYDFMSSISTPINKNLDGTVNFDWRYQKTPTLKKEDWFNYTLKFGLTFVPWK